MPKMLKNIIRRLNNISAIIMISKSCILLKIKEKTTAKDTIIVYKNFDELSNISDFFNLASFILIISKFQI